MTEHRIRLFVSGVFTDEPTDQELLDAAKPLGAVGCVGASVDTQSKEVKLEFVRTDDSWEKALDAAIREAERVGFYIHRSES